MSRFVSFSVDHGRGRLYCLTDNGELWMNDVLTDVNRWTRIPLPVWADIRTRETVLREELNKDMQEVVRRANAVELESRAGILEDEILRTGGLTHATQEAGPVDDALGHMITRIVQESKKSQTQGDEPEEPDKPNWTPTSHLQNKVF